ncbi:MAG: hypothetical protein IKE90_03040 [Bacilli bacterium]|nr:hypothetical protein [Bacilli bacterium]
MKNKIIIVTPSDEAYGLIDGDIKFLEDEDSYLSHSDILIKYGTDTYGMDSIFGILSIGNYLVDVPVYFLAEGNDNIVFLNVSNSKYGKLGLLYLPTNMSDKQKESLNSLSSLLKDFRVEVNYNLRIEDGFVDSDRHTMKGICGLSSKSSNKQKKA